VDSVQYRIRSSGKNLSYTFPPLYRVFKKEFYNSVTNVTRECYENV
jgi:hypothetical protein